jgi:hypothetical protein
MQELKPVAWIEDSEMILLESDGEAHIYQEKQHCWLIATPRMSPLYALPDTHRIVSVEDLKTTLSFVPWKFAESDLSRRLRAIIDKEPT